MKLTPRIGGELPRRRLKHPRARFRDELLRLSTQKEMERIRKGKPEPVRDGIRKTHTRDHKRTLKRRETYPLIIRRFFGEPIEIERGVEVESSYRKEAVKPKRKSFLEVLRMIFGRK